MIRADHTIDQAGRYCRSSSDGGWRRDCPRLTALHIKGTWRIRVYGANVTGQHHERRATVARCDFDFAFDHLNRSAFICHGYAERRALDDGRKEGRFNGKVRHRHLLDFVDDVTEILDDLCEAARFGGVGHADSRIGGDDEILFATDEYGTTRAAGTYDVARCHIAAAGRDLGQAGRDDSDLPRRFGQ